MPMNPVERVKKILDDLVGGTDFHGHGAFWRGLTRDELVAVEVFGYPLIVVGDGASSNLVRALKGESPFGLDSEGSADLFYRMPRFMPPATPRQIAFIKRWIDDGCPEHEAGVVFDVRHGDRLAGYTGYFKALDDWSLNNRPADVKGALPYVYDSATYWRAALLRPAQRGDWMQRIRKPECVAAIGLLSQRQRDTVTPYFGSPPNEANLFEAYALFGAARLPPDDYQKPHDMDNPGMWFVWSAFIAAAFELCIDTDFWRVAQRAVLIGLLHDGVMRGRFPVDGGFTADAAGSTRIFEHVAALADDELVPELAARCLRGKL